MQRKIIHIDMDAFYASVEQRDNPELRGKPIIVGGRPEERGVVCTASYEARKFGIKSAMSVKTAVKLCPDILIIRPNFSKYHEVSEKLIEFYLEYTDLIEPLSLDECYLDVSINKLGIPSATEIAFRLKEKIKRDLKLTASVGVASNKLLAKIASDINKPDGIYVIKPQQIEAFVSNLSVGKLWGVGKVTQERMKSMNILTCGDLQKYTMLELLDKFGSFGETLYYFARGMDERPVYTDHTVKSIASEETFSYDIKDVMILKANLKTHAETVIKRSKSNKFKARTITVKVKYFDFVQITRSMSLNYFTDDLNEIYETALMLFNKTEAGKKKVRLVGLSLGNLSQGDDVLKGF